MFMQMFQHHLASSSLGTELGKNTLTTCQIVPLSAWIELVYSRLAMFTGNITSTLTSPS